MCCFSKEGWRWEGWFLNSKIHENSDFVFILLKMQVNICMFAIKNVRGLNYSWQCTIEVDNNILSYKLIWYIDLGMSKDGNSYVRSLTLRNMKGGIFFQVVSPCRQITTQIYLLSFFGQINRNIDHCLHHLANEKS